MALIQWVPRQNRSGSARSAGIAPAGALAYLQLDTGASDFTDPAETLDFSIEWSADGGSTYGHLAGGQFVGSATITTRSGFRSVSVPVPPGCTHMRAGYDVVAGAPIRFGVLGEWR